MRFYAATFPDSEVTAVPHAPTDYPSGKVGDVLTVEFTVCGIPCLGLNGGPQFKHSCAFSRILTEAFTTGGEEAKRAFAAMMASKVNLPEFFAALGNPLRWEMVRMMAGGRMICARDCAAALGREFDGVSKHLRLLRGAGVVWSQPAQDRRFELYYIPETIRRVDGALDYGFCVIRVGPR